MVNREVSYKLLSARCHALKGCIAKISHTFSIIWGKFDVNTIIGLRLLWCRLCWDYSRSWEYFRQQQIVFLHTSKCVNMVEKIFRSLSSITIAENDSFLETKLLLLRCTVQQKNNNFAKNTQFTKNVLRVPDWL